MKKEIRDELLAIAEEDLKEFTAKLIPNVNNILGVRTPTMRNIAKRIAKQPDWESYLADDEDIYHEETMIRGFIINYAKISTERRLELTKNFVPRINNWAVCDCFCFNVKEKEKPLLWKFILPYLDSDKTYNIRFAAIMILGNFIKTEYAEEVFSRFEKVKNDDYYVKMGIAWTLSMFYVKLPEITLPFLKDNKLDDFTHNKSLQKIVESRQVDNETKDLIRTLKRKSKNGK